VNITTHTLRVLIAVIPILLAFGCTVTRPRTALAATVPTPGPAMADKRFEVDKELALVMQSRASSDPNSAHNRAEELANNAARGQLRS